MSLRLHKITLRAVVLVTCTLSLLWTLGAVGQEIHSSLCLHGCPFGSPATNDLLIRQNYILSSNDLTKFADWAAYKVTRDTIGPTQSRTWKADPWLAENETLEPEDYTGANAALGTERGHQVPLASFTGTDTWSETNYLSNITPQQGSLNGSAWGSLESAVRSLAQEDGVEGVYVMTGPYYTSPQTPLPRADEAHVIPSGYWKLVAIENDGATILAAFMFDQGFGSGRSFCDALKTPREVERVANLRLFHEMSESQSDILREDPGTLAGRLGCGAP